MSDNKIRFHYIRDPKNTKRVLTIARRVKNNVLEFGLALNCPEVHGEFHPDLFKKEMGRKIASGRLLTGRNDINCGTICIESDESPVFAAVQAIAQANGIVHSARRIAQSWLEHDAHMIAGGK